MISNKILFALLIFVAAIAFAGESPYNPNAAKATKYLFCQVYKPESRIHTVYFSDIFTHTGDKLYPVQMSYIEFLEKNYSYQRVSGMNEYNMPVRCVGVASKDLAEKQKAAATEREKYAGYEVIETGWTFGSNKSAEKTAESSSAADSPTGHAPAQDDKLDTFTRVTLEQDPRAARLSPLDRQFVINDAAKAKSYCAKDAELSHVLDCNCFVRDVFDYRIAHASGPIQTTNFLPLASVLEQKDFSCSKCVDPTRLAKWDGAKSRKTLACEQH